MTFACQQQKESAVYHFQWSFIQSVDFTSGFSSACVSPQMVSTFVFFSIFCSCRFRVLAGLQLVIVPSFASSIGIAREHRDSVFCFSGLVNLRKPAHNSPSQSSSSSRSQPSLQCSSEFSSFSFSPNLRRQLGIP